MFQNEKQEIDIDAIFANATIGTLEIRKIEKSVRHLYAEAPAAGKTSARERKQ